MQVGSPARASLEALWARAGQAGSLRLEVETVRVAEQERALAEARQHLQQWDCLVRTAPIPTGGTSCCRATPAVIALRSLVRDEDREMLLRLLGGRRR